MADISTTERIGRGICDGCGEEGELTAFNVAQVATGICICDACMAEHEAPDAA